MTLEKQRALAPPRSGQVPGGQVTAARAALTTLAVASAFVTSVLVSGATSLTPAATGAPSSAGSTGVRAVAQRSPWEAFYSERFPGCVALVLWPSDEVPVALVVRGDDGDISRVPLRTFREGASHSVRSGRAIGACR